VHLGGHDSSSKDTATDRDHAGEWALLVDVGTLNGGLGRTEAQTNVLVPSPVAGVLAGSADLVVEEDVRLSHHISIGCAGGSRNWACSTCFWKARSDWTLFCNQHLSRIFAKAHNVREFGRHGCGSGGVVELSMLLVHNFHSPFA
jgi:hypothetical protein